MYIKIALLLELSVCVCVSVCLCARVRMCVCVFFGLSMMLEYFTGITAICRVAIAIMHVLSGKLTVF